MLTLALNRMPLQLPCSCISDSSPLPLSGCTYVLQVPLEAQHVQNIHGSWILLLHFVRAGPGSAVYICSNEKKTRKNLKVFVPLSSRSSDIPLYGS